MSKTISIFGSSGIIGRKAVEIATSNGFEIIAIVGNKNHKEIIDQALRCKPRYVGVSDERSVKEVRAALSGVEVISGSDIENLAQLPVDCCVMAISGIASLMPTFKCLGYAKRLAIASKEAIILGGDLLIDIAKKNNTEIIPVDSEHNAIFQCLQAENRINISEIILTASGGIFRDFEEVELADVTLDQAIKNPNWIMGQKITIDSATMMNKAMEIIEAAYLFNWPIDNIKALIHCESIIHGLIKFSNNSLKALMSFPDMSIPISYAINYGDITRCSSEEIDLAKVGTLTFREAKEWQKRNINLAYEVFKGKRVIVFVAANDISVSKFMNREIGFNDIYNNIMQILEKSKEEMVKSISDIIDIYSINLVN
ncbi:MAG: 1-deoxy-D-xylulose-5-phosphate reductoisomerase [Holosporales bacterium]|jgi:1-deoxy-D-xylulose-5-phosphate reductoisomerase|nr:1-deoxy-D-xylulose-5-phosphate reductoisomerase [Holosporales bacterium]